MKVSVLIPTRNRPDFLKQAVFSVAASGFQHAFEIIVIHDGERIQPMTGVRSFGTPCAMGQSALMNIGFKEARGEYITVCEDDDMILPHKLAVLSAVLDATPSIGVAFSVPSYAYPDGVKPTPEQERAYRRLRQWLRDNPLVTWDTIVQHRGLRMHGTSTMYRRSAWELAGPWDETLTAGEEWEFHLRLLKAGISFAGLDMVTDVYRIHEGQKSGRARRRRAERMAQIDRINAKYAIEVPA